MRKADCQLLATQGLADSVAPVSRNNKKFFLFFRLTVHFAVTRRGFKFGVGSLAIRYEVTQVAWSSLGYDDPPYT